MKYSIRHITTYRYSEAVSLSQNHARLSPQHTGQQNCLNSRIEVFPKPAFQDSFDDHFDNKVTVFELFSSHKEMKVVATSEVEILPSSQQGSLSFQIPWEKVRDSLAKPRDPDATKAALFALPTPLTQPSPEMREYAMQSFSSGMPILDGCQHLINRIFDEFTFDASFSTISTPISTVFAHKRGVCQDFAHFTLACIRSLGLAAKYVSGYIETIPPPGQEKLEGADATHAWISVFVPSAGWIEYDPTNNLQPSDQHVTLATGRDFADITPIKGVMYGGGTQTLDVAVDMKRLEQAI
ncbi:transglutaminase family protein [Agaribacter flavus]|uniref:Transglutaminase N-terminal domain-containing protein n=1 Tax=Agaribacter flavus TaxID=1902781 RepID=A0ABV7FUQ2_9ALTE